MSKPSLPSPPSAAHSVTAQLVGALSRYRVALFVASTTAPLALNQIVNARASAGR